MPPSRRGKKTVSKKKIKDLTQGPIDASPLAPHEADDSPKYSMLQEVRNNMNRLPNCVVLTKVGSFYELYYEHATDYAPLLGLKPAEKGKDRIAMAGFPHWQLDRFLKVLVQDLNKYVAICEEFPEYIEGALRTPIDRKITRIISPGTLIDEKFLDPYENNFLLSLYIDENELVTTDLKDPPSIDKDQTVGLAWVDLSTGDFYTQNSTRAHLPSALMRVGAREIVISNNLSNKSRDVVHSILGHAHDLITIHKTDIPFTTVAQWNDRLEQPMSEEQGAAFSSEEKLAAHQVLDYVTSRLLASELRLKQPQRKRLREILSIDRSSFRGLEILETAREGFGKGSLFNAIRRTVTKSGSRLLRNYLTSPSASLVEIDHRLDLVSRFRSSDQLRDDLIFFLRGSYDVQRLVQKFIFNKGDADDMLELARAVSAMSETQNLLREATNSFATGANAANPVNDPLAITETKFSLSGPQDLAVRVLDSIDEEGLNLKHRIEEEEEAEVASSVRNLVLETAPEEMENMPKVIHSKKPGTIIKPEDNETQDPWTMRRHASATLAHLHDHLDRLKEEKGVLRQRLAKELNTSTLTLRWTPGQGYVCHIKNGTKFNNDLLAPLDGRMVYSTKSTKSFFVPEWYKLGERTDKIKMNIRTEEQKIFKDLRQLVIKNIIHLRRNAAIMDELDVATSLACLALEQGWTRPIVNEGMNHKILGGRHPTVKIGLELQGRTFVSNDLFLGEEERVWLVTGPNMAGKSTFLRQNALITILAQIGSYVPAEYAAIGLVDQIFSRIGAADDLFRDQSTFMVEMLETAAILKYSTPRSFVIMDEVGRGTTPEDGTAVSYASLHHLYYNNKCRTLFATHFHALADMTEQWEYLGHYCTDIAEDESGAFSFVHRLRPGVNRQSHALKVARMAGLPDEALDVAELVLRQLHQTKHERTLTTNNERQSESAQNWFQ